MPKPEGEGTKSTQKMPKHDSYASQTESSHGGSSSSPYNSGDRAGGRGKSGKSDPDGGAPAAGRTKYTSND